MTLALALALAPALCVSAARLMLKIKSLNALPDYRNPSM